MRDNKYSGKLVETMRSKTDCLCIVMVCDDLTEAATVGQELSKLNNGTLVAYRTVRDLALNGPAGRVALVILATNDTPAIIRQTLGWLRGHWPRCPVTVVGQSGGGDHEMAAREGGACYLTRPVAPEQWAAILTHLLGEQTSQVDMRDMVQ